MHTPPNEGQSQANYTPPNHHAPVNRPLRRKLSLFISVYMLGDMDIYLTLVFQALVALISHEDRIKDDCACMCECAS